MTAHDLARAALAHARTMLPELPFALAVACTAAIEATTRASDDPTPTHWLAMLDGRVRVLRAAQDCRVFDGWAGPEGAAHRAWDVVDSALRLVESIVGHRRAKPCGHGHAEDLDVIGTAACDARVEAGGIVKACACGRTLTQAAWDALPRMPDTVDGDERLEWRDCPCQSTIVRAWCARCGTEMPADGSPCAKCSTSTSTSTTVERGALADGSTEGGVRC